MKQFTKAQQAERERLVTRLRVTSENIESAVNGFNEVLVDAYVSIEHAVDEYNAAVAEANDFLNAVREDAQSYYDDRSEAWQSGEAGQTYVGWINELETEIGEAEVDECPEIEVHDASGADELENIPSEVGA